MKATDALGNEVQVGDNIVVFDLDRNNMDVCRIYGKVIKIYSMPEDPYVEYMPTEYLDEFNTERYSFFIRTNFVKDTRSTDE